MAKVEATIEPRSSFNSVKERKFEESPSSSGRDSLSDSPLSSLENLSSLLLSSHSLASMIDDLTSSSSLGPSTELSSHSIHNVTSASSEDVSCKSSNVFSSEESSNRRKSDEKIESKRRKSSTWIESKKKNDIKSTLPNSAYKLKVTLDDSLCDPDGAFIDKQLKDIGENTVDIDDNDHQLQQLSCSSSNANVNSSFPLTFTLSSPSNSNGNVLNLDQSYLDQSYKCNPLMAAPLKEKTGYTTDEKTNGSLSHYHSNNFTYSPNVSTCMSKGQGANVEVTLYENKLSEIMLLNDTVENEEKKETVNEAIESETSKITSPSSSSSSASASAILGKEKIRRKNHKEDTDKVYEKSHDSFCLPREVELNLDGINETSRD